MKWLLDIDREDGHCAEYVKRAGQRLIVSYSEDRAKKNAHNREKGVARLRMMEIGMSVDKVLFIAKTITTLKIRLPNGKLYTETLYKTPQQAALKPLIEGVAHAHK